MYKSKSVKSAKSGNRKIPAHCEKRRLSTLWTKSHSAILNSASSRKEFIEFIEFVEFVEFVELKTVFYSLTLQTL